MSSDRDHINAAGRAFLAHRPISDLQARVISAAWHDGQSSALYALSSSGAIVDGCELEILRATNDGVTHESPMDRPALEGLLAYVRASGERGPVDGWSALRW